MITSLSGNRVENRVFSKNSIIKNYSIFIALLPIFGIYSLGIPGFNSGEIILVVFTTICILENIKNKTKPINYKTTNIFIILLGYLIFSSLFSLLIQSNYEQITDTLIRTIRFSFFIICIVYTSRYYFNIEIATKWVTRISIIAAFYIIIQKITYRYFDILLQGHISFIPIYSSEIYNEFTYNIENFYRPTSFFLEPSHLVLYTVIGLILILFRKKILSKGDFLSALLISVGMILSTSIQGIVVLLLVWFSWAIRLIWGRIVVKNITILILFIIGAPLLSLYLFDTVIVQNTISRLMDGSNILSSNAFMARFQGYLYFDNVPSFLKFIGLGYGSMPNSNIFMSSVAYMLYGGGYFALSIILFLFLRLFIKTKNTISKIIILVSFVLLISTEWLYIYISVYFLSFICYGNNSTEYVNKSKHR